MDEEIESASGRARHIRPGVFLFLFIALVSSLVIYQIRTQEPLPRQYDVPMQTASEPSQSLPAELEDHEEESPAVPSPDISSSDMVLTQTAHRQPLLPEVKTVKEGELKSTSWQNPFYKLFWKNQGWLFTEQGMESQPDQLCIATFIRPYKRISVSFRVDVNQTFPDFELQLLTRDPAKPENILASSEIHFQNDVVSVTGVVQQTRKELKRISVDLSRETPASVPIRLVGTGNRFVISIGKRRLLTCAQPAAQSGKECFLCFLADKQPVHITSLRLEGE